MGPCIWQCRLPVKLYANTAGSATKLHTYFATSHCELIKKMVPCIRQCTYIQPIKNYLQKKTNLLLHTYSAINMTTSHPNLCPEKRQTPRYIHTLLQTCIHCTFHPNCSP